MLVNRLGDRSKRLGSKVVMYLDVLLQKHPHWKEVIAREVSFSMDSLYGLHPSLSSTLSPQLSMSFPHLSVLNCSIK